MKKIIIAIHGLGKKPARDLLGTWWLKAIHEGLTRIGQDRDKVPFEMVYWADVLDPSPMNPEIQDTEDPLYLDEPYTEGALIVKEEKTGHFNFELSYGGSGFDLRNPNSGVSVKGTLSDSNLFGSGINMLLEASWSRDQQTFVDVGRRDGGQ